MKYRLEFEGDFKKGNCKKCPLSYRDVKRLSSAGYPIFESKCGVNDGEEVCPLEEVEQGEWIKLTEAELDGAKIGYKCSICGATITGYNIDNLEAVDHCFSCGVKMKGGK